VVSTDALDVPNLRYDIPKELPALTTLLQNVRLEAIEIQHFLHLDARVIEAVRKLPVPYDVFIHDYAWICPRITLIDGSGGCGVTQSMSGNPYGAQIGAGASGFYWSDVSTGTVYTVAYGGTSSAVVTFATSQSSANMVTADSSYAYWTTNGTSILRAPSTGSPGTVHTVGSATSTITSMASDGNYVHFTYAGAVGHLSTSALTQTTTSATGSPTGVVASSGLVFWFVASTNTIYGMTYP